MHTDARGLFGVVERPGLTRGVIVVGPRMHFLVVMAGAFGLAMTVERLSVGWSITATGARHCKEISAADERG
jgi:hypothetical protein